MESKNISKFSDEPKEFNVRTNMFEQESQFLKRTEHVHSHSHSHDHSLRKSDEQDTGLKESGVNSHPLDDPEEKRHLKDVCSAFFNYQTDALKDVARMERDFNSLSDDHKKRLIFDYNERINRLKKSIWQNYLFLLKIVQPYSYMFKFFKSVISYFNYVLGKK